MFYENFIVFSFTFQSMFIVYFFFLSSSDFYPVINIFIVFNLTLKFKIFYCHLINFFFSILTFIIFIVFFYFDFFVLFFVLFLLYFLLTPYPSHFVLPFFGLRIKNHATYFMQAKITFRNINFFVKKSCIVFDVT